MGILHHDDVPESTQLTVYSTGAAAKATGLSLQSVIRLFDAGRIKGFKIPGSKFRRIPRENLLRFMLAEGIPLDGLGELSDREREIVAEHSTVIVARLPANRLTTFNPIAG